MKLFKSERLWWAVAIFLVNGLFWSITAYTQANYPLFGSGTMIAGDLVVAGTAAPGALYGPLLDSGYSPASIISSNTTINANAPPYSCAPTLSDNTTCLNAALNALKTLTTSGGTVLLGAGKYTFTGNPSFTYPTSPALFSVTLQCAGPDASILYWPNSGGGMSFLAQTQNDTIHLRNCTLSTEQQGSGTALTLTQDAASITTPTNTPPSDVSNVVIRGDDAVDGTDYWTTMVAVSSWSNLNFSTVTFGGNSSQNGNGVTLAGTSAVTGSIYNFVNANFAGGNVNITAGNYIGGIQYVNGTAIGGNNFLVQNGGSGTGHILIANSKINTVHDNIDLTGLLNGFTFTGNVDNVASGYNGILFNTANVSNGSTVSGNVFNGAGTATGTIAVNITAAGTTYPIALAGDTFSNFLTGIAVGNNIPVAISSPQFYNVTNTVVSSSLTLSWPAFYGTWTPTLVGSTTAGTPTYTVQVGRYQQVGRQLIANFYVAISALGSMAGNVEIAGLPQTESSVTNSNGSCTISAMTGITLASGYTQTTAIVQAGNSYANFWEIGSTEAGGAIAATQLAASSAIRGVCVVDF